MSHIKQVQCVFGVSTAYMYTTYKQRMIVISVQMQWNSLHTLITDMFSITILMMSFYTHVSSLRKMTHLDRCIAER